MPLQQVTHEFLTLVERETGYPARLIEDPNLPTLAKVQMARGTVPAHFIQYKPTRDESLDYLICYQCGYILRLFETPPGERYDLGVKLAKEAEVVQLLTGPAGKLARFGVTAAQAGQLAGVYLGGLLTHLRSIPIGMRVAEWLAENYPALRASQRATVLKELAEAKGSLQGQVREITPDEIYLPTMAINAAHAMFWAERYGRRELSAPYRSYGYDAGGRALLKLWRAAPADPAHDRELVDSWAAQLGLTGWYEWLPYTPPQ